MSGPDSRTPPHSLEAERSVLGAVFIKPAALDDCDILHIDDFFLPAHREIFEAMRAVAKAGKPVDVLIVADELKAAGQLSRLDGGIAYLSDLANAVPTAENVGHYATIVRDAAVKRRLIAAASEILSTSYGGAVEADEALADARAKIANIELVDASSGPTAIGDEIGATLDSIEHRGERPDDYFMPTGLRAFDDHVGGIRGGNLITIAARPGKGKSALALQILIHNAFRGVPCLLFSFEMSKAEIVERAIAQHASIDGRAITSGRLRGPEWIAINDSARRLSTLPLWLVDKPMKLDRMLSNARRWTARQRVKADQQGLKKLAVVCCDYLGLIESSGAAETRALEVGAMTRGLKQFAAEEEIPVIEVSQLNRDSEKEGGAPKLSHLRDSGSIEQDSNMVLFPIFEEVTGPKPPDWWPAADLPQAPDLPAAVIVGKNRGGPIGRVPAIWQPRYVRFVDLPDYDHQPTQEELAL